MKTLLSLMLLCATGYAAAFHNVEDFVNFANTVKGKTVEIPAQLAEKAHEFKAKALRMHAHQVREVAKQIKNPLEKHKYIKVAKQIDLLADNVEFLPAHNFRKTFRHPEKMLLLKAAKAELMAEKLRLIGRQLHDEKLVQKADKVEQWGKQLKDAVLRSKCQAYEGPEAMTEAREADEGADYAEANEEEEEEEEMA